MSVNQPEHWHPDRLGAGFSARALELGPDPLGEGDLCATLVRYYPGPDGAADAPATTAEDGPEEDEEFASRPALLWVHGMTDYFFQAHVARYFHARGYAFYAIDLHKCGRSRRDGQTWHYAAAMEEYYADLDAALEVICGPHPDVTPLAHSTAGVIVPLWLDRLRTSQPAAHARVSSAIFNSPWLDIMGVPKPVLQAAKPVINAIGKAFPKVTFTGGGLSTFGASIHASRYGEWDYDTTLKPLSGHKKYLGWLRGVIAGQDRIHQGAIDIGVPGLVLCSTRSRLGKPYSPETDTADAVVDVSQTVHWAPRLGNDITVCPILGARHEVFLSLPPARREAFEISSHWLARAH
ncbi:alpha/beta hydrolase [Corynebacterium confusum]